MAHTPIDTIDTALQSMEQAEFDRNMAGYMTQLPDLINQMNVNGAEVDANRIAAANSAAGASASASSAEASAAAASSSAAAAAASAASAVGAPGTSSTSTTSVVLGTGLKTITIQTGKLYKNGQFVAVANSVTALMSGPVDTYDPATGQLTFNSVVVVGSGTFASWTISVVGAPGALGVINESKGTSIASASTINLDTASGNLVHITGTSTINTITLAAGAARECVADGAVALTHSASLDLPGQANIVAGVGDVFTVRGDGAGVTIVTKYQRANGQAIKAPYALGSPIVLVPTVAALVQALNFVTSNANGYLIELENIAPASGTGNLQLRFAVAGVVDSSNSYGTGASGSLIGYILASLGASSDGKGISGQLFLQNLNSSSGMKCVTASSMTDIGGSYSAQQVTNGYIGGSVSGISFSFLSGVNFAAQGAIRIYPILNA